MIKLFLFFLLLIFTASVFFAMLYSGFEYECWLPRGGYLIIRWNEAREKMEVVYMQPAKKKVIPKNTLHLRGTPVKKKSVWKDY